MSAQRAFVVAMGAGLLLAASIGEAAENPALPEWAPKPEPTILEDRFRAEVSLLAAAYDTQVRVDPSLTVQGTHVAAEDDLAHR